MNTNELNPASPFLAILNSSGRYAMQWRLLLLWLVTLLIPTALLTLPVWQIIASQLNYSVHASTLAHSLTMNVISDLMSALTVNSMMLQQAGIGSCVLVIVFSPFLSGAVVTAARSQKPLPMGKLVHGGIAEYWRMFRLLLWAIIPLGIACGIGAGALYWAHNYGEKVILQSDAEMASYTAITLLVVLFIIADASVDAARAQFVLSTTRRSAIKAWWRGMKMIAKRPLPTLGFYIVITIIGAALSAGLGLLHMNIDHINTVGFLIGLVLTQVMVACNAWMRIARLFALASLSKTGVK